MTKVIKKIDIIVMAIIMLFGVFGLTGCMQNPNRFTEEEHIQRVSERIERQFVGNTFYRFEITGFSVYPLYNNEGYLRYLLVDFEPAGFMYVSISRTLSFPFPGVPNSMYSLGTFPYPWRRYTVCEYGNQPWPNRSTIFETDDNGDYVFRYKSHFREAGIKNERRYLLRIVQDDSSNYVPSVRRGDYFFNLISMQEMNLDNEITRKRYAVSNIRFIPHRSSDL